MLKIQRSMTVFFLCLSLASCGGGGGNSSSPAAVTTPTAPPKPQYYYGEGYLPQCQTDSIIAASIDPQGPEIMQIPGTGNQWDPDPNGKVMQVCSSHITVHMTQADFDNQVFRLTIDAESQGQVGSIAFNQMYCEVYGANVNVNTWIEGWGDIPPGFINMPTSTFNQDVYFTDTNGKAVLGTGETGGNYGLGIGGELLVTSDPQIGQVVKGSSQGGKSCTDATHVGTPGNWVQSTIDTIDHYGTATHPIINTGLYEPTYGNVFNYTSAQYVGMTDYLIVNLTHNPDGTFAHDANGNLIGKGWHYWALRTDRLLDSVPGAPTPIGWTNS